MDKKTIAFIVILIVILAIGGYVFGNLKRQPVQTVEQSTSMDIKDLKEEVMENESSAKLKQGSFVDGDALHKGAGESVIYQTKDGPILVFENFSVTVGPDVFVYLSKNDFTQKRELGEFVSLGKIKDFKGDQTYNLPDNFEDYQSVAIWCRAFGVLFAYAPLK